LAHFIFEYNLLLEHGLCVVYAEVVEYVHKISHRLYGLILSTDSAYLKKCNMSISNDSMDIAIKPKVKFRFHEVAI
jgi:hypothetical protein